MERPTQRDRPIELIGPLDEDDLLLQSFSGQEGISIPFHFDLLLLAPDPEIASRDVVGKAATIRVDVTAGRRRFINGIISSFTQTDSAGQHLARYHATLVPALWGTTRKANCAVFQNLSVPQIIRRVWAFPGINIDDTRLTASRYQPREICIQYSETNFQFGSRLLEEEGIFYFFRHVQERDGFKHVLVIADEPHVFDPVPDMQSPTGEAAVAEYRTRGSAPTANAAIRSWSAAEEMRPDSFRLRDYDFANPRLDLEVSAHTPAGRQLEIYDYPGEYVTRARGQQLVDVRIEEIETAKTVVSGSGTYRQFIPGFRFNLSGHFRRDFNGRAFAITSVFHSFKQQNVFLGSGGPAPSSDYCNTFQCIPHPTRFRPARTTRMPVIAGAQTATVVGPNTVGPDGNVPPVPPNTQRDDIYTDQHGRVKVRFHWDRTHLNGDTTCFIRVAQPWANVGFGHQWIPRVGSEVVVTFLEGNPDRPLIVGSVYNGANRVPFTIPECKTQSGIRTHTNPYDPDSRDDKFHMLRFDDKAEREQVFLRSQKRLDVRALGSYYDTCGGDRNTLIGWKDERSQGGDHNLTVGNDHNVHVQGGRYDRIEKVLNLTVVGNVVQDWQANAATLVGQKSELNAQQIIMEASQKICLKCGSSFVLIEPSGVTIYGSSVKINSGGWGVETGDPTIEDPLDAVGADTGKPCNRLHTAQGGGGRRTRRSRQLRSQHAASTPRPGEDPRITAIRNRLQHSAVGRHAIEVYDRYGVTPSFTPGVPESYDPATNNVNLNPTGGDDNGLAFVHEMSHAQDNHEGREPDIDDPDRANYVDQMLQREARASSLENEADRELGEAGLPRTNSATVSGPYDRGYNDAADAYRRAHPNATPEEIDAAGRAGGEQAVLDEFRSGRITTEGEPYPDYYGHEWDDAHRAPGAGGADGGPPDGGPPDGGVPGGPTDAAPPAGVP